MAPLCLALGLRTCIFMFILDQNITKGGKTFSKVAILIQEMVFLIIKLFQVEHWWLDKISDYIRTSQIEIDNKKNKIQKVTKSKNIKWSLLQWCWLNRFLLDSSKELDFHLNPPNSTQLRGWGYHEIPPKVCGRYTCILHVMV